MKPVLVSIVAVLLLIGAAVAHGGTAHEELEAQVRAMHAQVQDQELPGALGKFFGNERINIYIAQSDGEKEVVGLRMERRKVVSLSLEELAKPTIKIYTSQETMGEIMNSKNQIQALKKSLDSGKITYSGVGLKNKVKFAFIKGLLKATSGFMKDEPANAVEAERKVEAEKGKEPLRREEPVKTEKATEQSQGADTPLEPAQKIGKHDVEMNPNGFSPDEITIKAGDSIVWRNTREGRLGRGMILGTRLCAEVKSGMFGPGESFEWTFTKPGSCIVVDGVLTTKTMTVTVVE